VIGSEPQMRDPIVRVPCSKVPREYPRPQFLAGTAITQLFEAFSTTEYPTGSGAPRDQSMKLGL
jgi:hypothetical protein